MSKIALISIIILLILLPLACANNVELEIISPESGSQHITNGDVTIKFTIENKEESPETATDVKLEAEEDGISFSSGSTNIAPGETEDIILTASGFIWKKTSVRVKVVGNAATEDVDGDSISISLVPPYMDLEIISPKKEVVLLDKADGSSANLDVLVKNTGGIDLKGVKLSADGRSGMTCTTSSGSKTIGAGSTEKYSVNCNNITSGDHVNLRVEDSNDAASDIESVSIRFAESFKFRDLNITSPYENEEFRFGEYGGTINLEVKNTGDTKLEGICASLFGINYTSDSCIDLDVGKTHTFKIGVAPSKELTIVKARVGDTDGYANDEVGIRVLRLEGLDQNNTEEQYNDTEELDNNVTKPENQIQSEQNNKTKGPTNAETKEKQDPDKGHINTGFDYLIAIIIVIVLVALGLVVKAKEKAR